MKRLLFCLMLAIFAAGCSGPAQNAGGSKGAIAEQQNQQDIEVKSAELARDKQEAIWDAEHITFEIEWQFGPPFKDALKSRDRDRMLAAFRDEFTGKGLAADPVSSRKGVSSEIQETSYTATDGDTPIDAGQLVDGLIATTSDWSEVTGVGMRVLYIDKLPVEHQWRTRLLVTQDGLKGASKMHAESEHLVVWSIEDETKMADAALIDDWRMLSMTVKEGRVKPLLEEVTEYAQLHKAMVPDNWDLPPQKAQQYRFGTAVADFNLDGYLDIAVAAFGEHPVILRGNKSMKFHDVTQLLGIVERRPMMNFLAAWIDYDNDGYPDLLLGDRMYHNEKGKKFVDVTTQSGLFIHTECMGASVVDYDADGNLDLYILYQRDWDQMQGTGPKQRWVNEEESGRTNDLWKNVGGRFINVTERANAGGGKKHTHSASWFFFDDDHLPDVYMANDFGKNSLLRNKGDGSFEDVSESSATSDFATSMGVATGDVDNDGRSEIYVANMYSKMGRRIIAQVDSSDYPDGIHEQILGACAGNRLYAPTSPGKPHKEIAVEKGVSHVGWAFGPAFADFDNNGFLDVYSTTGFMSFERGKPDG